MERARTRTGPVATVAAMLLLTVGLGWLLAARAEAQQEIHILWPASSITTRFTGFGDGGNLGDRLTSRGPLTDVGQSEQIGTAYQECVVMRKFSGPTTGLWRCSYVLDLAPGLIVVEGMDPRGPGVYRLAVLGGSGGYAGATGDATFTDGVDGTDMVIHLTS